MRLFNSFGKERKRKPFSLRRRQFNDSKRKKDEENDDGSNGDGKGKVEDELSSFLLLEITDERSTYYELPPPTLRVTNTGTAITNSSSGASSKINSNTSAAGKNAFLNRYHDSSALTTTTQNRPSSTSLACPSSHVGVPNTFSPTNISSRRRNKSITTKGVGGKYDNRSKNVLSSPLYATILDLPHLVHALQTTPTVTCDAVSHTLRRLFALSEYSSSTMKGGGTINTNASSTTTATSSECESLEQIRKQMVLDASSLVPALFHFLIRCYVEDTSSPSITYRNNISESMNQIRNTRREGQSNSKRTVSHPVTMYLALLVLNNLCIPNSNKRYIAFQCHGIDIICHLLCYDPSCRMLAIVLVNLTFGTNVQFQHDLLFENETNTDTKLLSSLAYALRVASLTRDEYNIRQRLFMKKAHEIFSWDSRHNTLVVDSTAREQQLNALLVFDQYGIYTKAWPAHSEQIFPDTARWCTCALHHLTRPLLHYSSKNSNLCEAATDATKHPYNSSAVMALTRTNIVQHLLCCIRIGTSLGAIHMDERPINSTHRLICRASSDSHVLSDQLIVVYNDPSTWVKETSQDAALFVIMNISIDPYGRKYLLGHDIDTIHLLASIADSCHILQPTPGSSDISPVANQTAASTNDVDADTMKVKQFQCVKARMTLSYLVGSKGHYGQDKTRIGKWVKDYIQNRQVLTMKDPFEVEALLDVLAHTMYRRTKDGAGGFSGTTFRIKYIVWAIRCLLTQPDNQEMFAGNGMEVLNALLLKILALRAARNAAYIDSETAEHACFSLYLLSHYGFHICFLPSSLGKDYNVRYIVTKTLIAIQSIHDTTLATHHAIRQILYRLRYLLCIDTALSITAMTTYAKWRYQRYHDSRIIDNDNCIFEQNLVSSVRSMLISEKVRSGAQPRPDIFNRPIISYRRDNRERNLIDDDDDCGSPTNSTYYNSAIHAAYDFSFQSTIAHHLNDTTIDDIAIANNVADCADGKTNVESYGCTWAWDDDAEDGADKNHQGGTPHVREGRRRINRPMVQSSAHNISSLLSSLLLSPRNCCGGGSSDGILCTDPNDESYDENFMEEW